MLHRSMLLLSVAKEIESAYNICASPLFFLESRRGGIGYSGFASSYRFAFQPCSTATIEHIVRSGRRTIIWPAVECRFHVLDSRKLCRDGEQGSHKA